VKGYPVFLIGLERRHCIVVGGNREAQRKVEGLLECDARVTVIAPRVTELLERLALAGRVERLARDYQTGDLRGAFLVIATGQGPAERAGIWEEARAEGALVNVTDDVEHCNFIAGSVMRRGPLTLAISTNGRAPALAVRLRERFEREFGPEYGELLDLLGALRERLTWRRLEFEERRELWYRLVDSDVLVQLRAGRRELARERIEQILGASVADRA
jgi:siroheme synthase-like protein